MWKWIYPVSIWGIFLSIFLLSISPITDLDIWWHLATGRQIIESGQVPRTDIFSHTVTGKEWVDHSWFSQVIFYLMYSLLGYTGVVLTKSLALFIAFYFLYMRTSLNSGKLATVITLIAVISVTKGAWLERPMIFTIMFTSIFLYILDRKWHVWILPLLIIPWVNLHGGYIVGVLVILLFTLGTAVAGDFKGAKRLSQILGASITTSLINPYSYNILIYPFQYATDSIHSAFIIEWQSPQFHIFSVYETLILLTFIGLVLRKRINVTDILLLLVFTHLSLFAVRNVSLYAIVCTPIIIKYLESPFNEYWDRFYKTLAMRYEGLELAIKEKAVPGFVYTAVALSYILFFVSSLTSPNFLDTSPSKKFPNGAIEYILENEPQGELYNHYMWGGYCIWTLYPKYKVFIDGRADMYGDFIFEYLQVHKIMEGWDDTLTKYNVSLVLIPRGDPVDILLRESSGWDLAYKDDMAVIYSREINPYQTSP
jgi:hypothetical protein